MTRNSLNTILVSLVFAIAILASSWLIEDEKQASTVMFALITLWWIPYSYFLAKEAKKKRQKNSDDPKKL